MLLFRCGIRLVLVGLLLPAGVLRGQEKSINPEINRPFTNKPSVAEFLKRFETESREIYQHRGKLVEICKLKPGIVVADIGAGTGLFTRMFAEEVGSKGKVYAVDIAPEFLDHINATAKKAGLGNIQTVRCTPTETALPPGSVDLAFVCDTYHHFEFPQRTLASLFSAIRPGGELVVVDFYRRKEISSDFVMQHVRADRDVFAKEIADAGFESIEPGTDGKFLKENYVLRFRRPAKPLK